MKIIHIAYFAAAVEAITVENEPYSGGKVKLNAPTSPLAITPGRRKNKTKPPTYSAHDLKKMGKPFSPTAVITLKYKEEEEEKNHPETPPWTQTSCSTN